MKLTERGMTAGKSMERMEAAQAQVTLLNQFSRCSLELRQRQISVEFNAMVRA